MYRYSWWNRGQPAQIEEEDNKISKQTHDLSGSYTCYIQQKHKTASDYKIIIDRKSKSKTMLLISRFIRNIYDCNENKYNMIPTDIQLLIFLFCNKVDRFIYGIGYNSYGCFGIGHNNDINTWNVLAQFSSLCYGSYYKINCGYQRYLIETQNNCVYIAGYNQYGSCLINQTNKFETTSINKFQCINDRINEIDIKLSSNGVYAQHSFIVDKSDNIYVFGCNLNGQYGNGTFDKRKKFGDNLNTINHYIPIKINDLFCKNIGIRQIECGSDHTLFLLRNGKVFSCGSNLYSQCGIDSKYNQIINDKKLILKPTEIKLNEFIIDIQCGAAHNLMLTRQRRIYVFGKNKSHQLGVTDIKLVITPILCEQFKDKEINVIKCGENHSFCIDIYGKCYLFGSNSYGQIGNGKGGKTWDYIDVYKFKYKIVNGSAANHTVLISDCSQKLYTFGNNNYNQCGIGGGNECHIPRTITLCNFDEFTNIAAVIAGYQSTLVVIE